MRRPQDTGSVTAELAIGMVTVVALLAVVLAVAAATAGRVRCVDAARGAVRVAALGEDDAAVRAAAVRVAGSGATVAVTRDDGWVTVTVSAPVAGPFGELRARATTTGRSEP